MPIPYCGVAPLPAELWGRWNLAPYLLTALALGLALLLLRGPKGARGAAALAAWAVLALVFVSPLCALASALFAARSLHHVLLVALAAPLLALAGLAPRRGLSLAVPAHLLVLWAWHAPPAYAAALASDAVYWLMQLSLLGSAAWFWGAALARGAALPGIGALLAGMVGMGMLGALLTFAPTALYAPHATTTQAWGLSPLQDQQLAGLLMWVPAALAYLLPALAQGAAWLRAERG
ncbi:cytochrome c oxidase assembly protein [Pseudoroseomonas cervicalis]|uniref:cytochrome c oxidase assembly protein n=1 Tax=Teichococcus cervicalis TaxID=204525 RepID=UPI0022F1AFB8|nr:cytochrome c oxidase assembly protein [Pseudoroseomonas cervicalis]WBV43454.1 cytochrome c oxidase assembly protein [Pseudoroseomonas cervicalis]